MRYKCHKILCRCQKLLLELHHLHHHCPQGFDSQAGEEYSRLGDLNPFQYEEGRETFGVVIIILWMKMTSHVSKTQFR